MATTRRIGLVLGAGGVLGSSWMVGALAAVSARIGRPLVDLDLIVGTSAGSILAAALRAGMTVEELVAHQRGETIDGVPDMRTMERETGDGLPPLPYPWLGSPRLLARAATRPWRVRPVVAASALLPLGRARLNSVISLMDGIQGRLGVTSDYWVPGRPLWVCAVDYDTGRRVVFGREGGPPGTLADAVLASCAIPGWLAPRSIGGRRYVDGGLASVTSLDLLAKDNSLDEVYVLAPMASYEYDSPSDPLARAERAARRLITLWLSREVRAVRATGMKVQVLTPGPEDLTAIGFNVMNPRHRSRVLETSLRTSAMTVEELDIDAA
ncbi:MAG TPA: patatin-like phospholipase family protein [Pseudonocardia sp.]|jgi:NTE family protein|nr:patatin-like phospholipase family protein [Pseudonocardia sp.]